jgi:hypothetical protein
MSLYYLAFLTVGVLTAYAFVGRFIFYKKTYEAWLWWVFAYFHVQAWGGYAASEGFQQGKFAMLQAFLIKNRPGNVAPSLTTEIAQTLFLYVLLALLGSLILRIGSHWSRNRQVLWVSFLWIAAFVPFFIWWEPWNIEFWVSSTAPCWILIGTVVADLSIRWRNPVLHFANRSFVLLVWTGVIALLFLYNFQERAPKVPHGPKPILDAIQAQIKPDDLLILDGINTIPLYLDRYQKRNYLNLHAFFRKYQPKTGEAAPVVTQRPADPWKDLKGLVEQSWKRRHRVWVLTEVVDENDGWYGKFERLMQFPMGQLSTFFHQYDLKPVPYNGNVYYYELKKPAAKQDP